MDKFRHAVAETELNKRRHIRTYSSFDGLEDLDLYSLQNHHRVRRKEQFSD